MGPATRYALDTCTDELCALMTTGFVALGFDEESQVLRKVGTSCSMGSFTGTPDAFVCSVNPPYLQYSQNYDIDFLPDYAYVYDVAVQSNTSDLAFAAGTELTVLRMKSNGRFERIGKSPIYHYGVQSSQFVDGLVFATQSSAFAILDVTNPSIPKEYTVPIDGYSCAAMGEYKTSTAHVVYVGCPYYGVWPVDVSTTTKPVMLGNGTASLFYEIGWETSLIRGLLVDSDRDLLFSAWTSYQVGIRMSDLKTDKEYPTLLDHYENISPYRMMLRGTVLYAATTSGLEVLETVNRKLESLSSCCDDGPILNLRGVTMYGEYLYASDYNGRIVVMNATNPTQPTYAAHKDFPAEMGTYAYGGDGIVASAFSDGSVRIMQAARGGDYVNYVAVRPAENDKDVLFALRQSGFDIVALTPPQSPKVLTSVKIDAPYSCVAMDQIRRGALVHVVFASCKKYGVYGIDVRDNANPVLLNNGAPVMQPLSGVAKGIATDEDRKLLFVTTIESGASLYMYDVTDPSKPTTVSSLSVQFDAHGVTRAGTLLYIAASDKMYVYESKDKALAAVGSCCTNAAAMDLYGGDIALDEFCDTGDVLMSAAMIDTCGPTTLCALMPDNTEAGFDSSDETYKKTAGVCSIESSSTKPSRFVCGPPPPLTLFVVQYDQDFFPDYTSVRAVAVMGPTYREAFVATTNGLMILQISDTGRFKRVGTATGDYYGALASEALPGVFYGLRSSYLDIFILDDPTNPTLKASSNWWGYSCASLKEYKQGSDVFVYVSCPSYGVWAVNVTDISNPALTTSQGDGFFEPVDGDTRGLAVDTDRSLLYLATSGTGSGLYALNIGGNAALPVKVTYYPSDNSVYEVAVSDGKIYAAAKSELEVYDFVNNEFVALTSCCSHGPKLDLRGVTIYGDLAYLSDYNAKLVVMNVSSALSSPYYIGHRDLPSDSGSMAGQAGVVVTMLGDGQMHVLQAGYSAGLMTFSDVEPGPTPAPPTPLPPPPVEPMDCSHVFVEATSTRCPEGFVLMNEHLIESCFDDSLCAKLTAGVVYKCDTTTGVAVVKTGTQCFFSDLPASEPSQALCGTPPPYTTYSLLHKVLDTYSYARDLDIMGSAGKEIVLAHTDGVSVFSAEHSTGFELRGTYPGYFYSVMAAAHNADLVYAARYGTVELVSFSPPTAPRKVSAVDITNPWPTCYHMEQLYVKSEGLHVLYLSCGYRGLYGVDVSDDNNLVVLNNGQKLLSPANGDIQGLFVDLPRRFLFAVSDTAAAEVYMFNVSTAEKPMRLSSYELESPGIAIVVEGTVAYAAGQEKVEIFETNTMAFVPISWCCQQAPDMNLRGITWYNGLLYASDSSPRLFVMNVTDPTLPYYDGHREISEGGTTSSNPQKIKVGKLADNVMRVFQVVYSSGFVVYSDEVPPPTPAPPTPLPPPPIIPPDCSQLYVFDTSTVTDDSVCNEGHVLLSEHIIEACDEACDAMSDGWIVNFDGQAGQVYKKTGTSCTFEDGGDQTRKLCGPPPPLTAYKTDIDDGYFQSTYASIYSVLLLGDARSEFLVAHSDGMTVVTLNNEGLFNPMTQYESTNTYYDLQIMMGENAVVIAARAYGIDILDVSNLLKPKKIGSAEGNGYSCYDLAQYQTATSHTVYEGCDYSGVYIYDVTDKTKPAKKGSALEPSTSADIGGVLVDNSRAALFITGESWSDDNGGIYLYNLTTSPLDPEYVSSTKTDISCFDMVMVGTTLYVAGGTQLLIYDTSDLASWVQLGFCCHFGPELDIQSLDVYSGMVYAADYDGRLIVMNVTDPQAPYYLGHHELTSSYAARKVVVGTLKDNVQRVFAANDYYGLSILTDVEPPPTPAPPTPFPPPPMPPMDCSNTQLVSYVSTGDSCPKGMIVIPDHFAGICATTICDQLTATDFVEIDYFSNYYYVKDGTTCKRVYDSTGYPTKTFCIVPPAHMTYKEGHTEVLATSAKAYDVAILGYDSNDVVVATDKGLTVLRGAQSTGLVKVGHVDGDYVAVIAAEHTTDVVFALLTDKLDVISLMPPATPKVMSYVFLASTECNSLAQYRKNTVYHMIYTSCGKDGVFAFDAKDMENLTAANNGDAVITVSGSQGVAIDEQRQLLFLVTDGSASAVYMYDITDPKVPVLKATSATEFESTEVVMNGDIAYIAARDKLEIYSTSGLTFEQLGYCCVNSPSLEIEGIAYRDGIVYASDRYDELMAFNVSDPYVPYYAGHREIGGYNYGARGVVVAALGDGIVRVFQAATGAGIMVYSDMEPVTTPTPATAPPPPPLPPMTCDDLYITAENVACADDEIMMNEHMINRCKTEVCSKLAVSTSAMYDANNMMFSKDAAGTCSLTTSTGTVTRSVCGPSPPYTRHYDIYDIGFLPDYAYVYDVNMLGFDSDVAVSAVYPEEIEVLDTTPDIYQIELVDTVLYVCARTELSIYETATRAFSKLSSCCDHGPTMYLRGLQYYEGLVYASDYYGMLIVMNVTDTADPYYIGHRELPPSSGTYKYAREGVHVGQMKDGITRVFQAAASGGVAIWSDVVPPPTPVPNTPMPPPPPVPMDCGHVFLYEKGDDGEDCPVGKVTVSQYIIDECDNICDNVTSDMEVGYDGSTNSVYYNSGTACVRKTSSTPTKFAFCGSAAPHTTYVEPHGSDVVIPNSRAYYVAVLGRDSNDIVVATTGGLTILRAESNLGFKAVSHVSNTAGYYCVKPAENDKDMLFALSYKALDIISLSPPTNPTLLSSIAIPSLSNCLLMDQIRRSARVHIVYITCQAGGVFGVDVADSYNPVLLNGGNPVMSPLNGNSKGITTDEDRQLLFISTISSSASVYMYDVKNATSPVLLDDAAVANYAAGIVIHGTILYVGADEQLVIFETKTLEFEQLSFCCDGGPPLEFYGLAYYDGLIYGSDYYQKVFVFNVTDPRAPHYLSHKTMPMKVLPRTDEKYICGPPPPYTRYIEQYDLNVFPDYSYIRDVDALSQESGLVIVAGSYELSVMQLQSNGWLKRVGRIPGYYYGALASTDKNTVYGLRSGYLDVADVSDPTSPKIQGTAQFYGYSCEYLEEYEVASKRYVFAGCPSYGVWVVDVTDRKTPAVVTTMSTPSLKPTTGMVEGMVIDHVRKLLFLGTSGKVDESGVHMYSLGSSPAIPLEQHRFATDDYTYAIALHGTTIFVAADTKVEVYETKNLKLEPITSCCGFGPDLDLRGITYYNGLLYASDYAGLLVVMNATDPQAPFYIGHRAMPAES
ncbi:hypothetical protein DIPPA_25414, partial [Diplonema papillatum]